MAEKIVHGSIGSVADEDSTGAAEALREAQGELVGELVGLGATMCAAMDEHPGFVPCEHAFGVVIEGLAASLGGRDIARVNELAEAVRARSEHVSEHRGVAQGAAVDACEAVRGNEMCALALAGIQAAAVGAETAMELGTMSEELDVALIRVLAGLGNAAADAHELVRLAAKACVAAQQL